MGLARCLSALQQGYKPSGQQAGQVLPATVRDQHRLSRNHTNTCQAEVSAPMICWLMGYALAVFHLWDTAGFKYSAWTGKPQSNWLLAQISVYFPHKAKSIGNLLCWKRYYSFWTPVGQCSYQKAKALNLVGQPVKLPVFAAGSLWD